VGNLRQWSFGKLRTICLGTSGIQYQQFIKGRNCEIHVDVGLHLIFVKGLSDICGRAFVGLLC